MKIARILGTRPQFMQAPSLYEALKLHGVSQTLIHSGQHYDDAMSGVFFRDLGLPPPDINLSIGGLSHGAGTGRMMEQIEGCLLDIRPDAVVVDGDTNTTMAAALAACKLNIPVVHLEAGLRDFDRNRPEEINRIVSDHVASLNLAPIPRALKNLENEGLGRNSKIVGDLLCDCFLRNRDRADPKILDVLGVRPGQFNITTLHRPENTDVSNYQRFASILDAVNEVGTPVIFPLHPRTKPVLEMYRSERGGTGVVQIIEPLSYISMLSLMSFCDCVFTDSGGLPREAVWANRRVVMLFRVDTWHDLLEHGWAQIGKSDKASVLSAYGRAVPAPDASRAFFGDGAAGARAAASIVDLLNNGAH
jgi:UDP-N-acetylglucosamine 2-epimerase